MFQQVTISWHWAKILSVAGKSVKPPPEISMLCHCFGWAIYETFGEDVLKAGQDSRNYFNQRKKS